MNIFRRKTRTIERRAQIRNKLPGQDFEARLRTVDGRAHDASVMELTGGGAKVRLSTAVAENCAIGSEVVLELVLSNPAQELHLVAEVRRREGRLVSLMFLEPDLDDISLDAESRILLSRRKYPRLRLQEHVTIELTVGQVVVSGTVADLSERGVGMVLDRDLAGRLDVEDVVRISLQLPRTYVACDLAASVRHRTPFAGALLIGLEFIDPGDVELDAIRDFLHRSSAR